MTSRPRGAAVGAGLLYLALALWVNRATLGAPFERLPMPARHAEPALVALYEADQAFVVANVARMARSFTSAPWRLGEPGLCAPMTRPYTLGEHMFGEGLLGALPMLATGDPLFTYNAVIVLSTWISALAMYALAFYWTRSAPAALVAGLLFAFHPQRLNNPAHLFGFGNAWTAAALMAAHSLLTRRRWFDAALLSLFVVLQLLESFYQVLGLALAGGAFALYFAVKHARHALSWGPKAATAAAVAGLAAWWILTPYLHTQDVWGVLQGRQQMFVAASAYLPGGRSSPGVLAWALVVVALLDRCRGPRRDGPNHDDARVAFSLAGVLVFWCSVKWVHLPMLGPIPSLLRLLGDAVPGLGAVRVVAALQFTEWLLFAAVAAYGVVALIERFGDRGRWVATALLVTAILAESLVPNVSWRTYRTTAELRAYDARPPETQLRQLANLPPGGVVDLPLDFTRSKLQLMPPYMIAAGYHDRPVAACYNSFLSGVQREVARLVRALPDPRAAQALSGLELRTLRVHRDDPAFRATTERLLGNPALVEPLDLASDVSIYRLRPVETTGEFATISARTPSRSPVTATRPEAILTFGLVARGDDVFVHPDPIEPSPLVVTWRDPAGGPVQVTPTRALLPAALAPGQRFPMEVGVRLPDQPGLYRAELARAAEPERLLSSILVRVD